MTKHPTENLPGVEILLRRHFYAGTQVVLMMKYRMISISNMIITRHSHMAFIMYRSFGAYMSLVSLFT
jgi:hypothetical protein